MSEKVRKKAVFVWDEQKLNVAEAIAKGNGSVKEILTSCGITERIYYKWKKHPEFQLRINEIIADIDISLKAERIKIAKAEIKRVVARLKENEDKPGSRDLVALLKFVGEEVGDYEPVQKVKHEISLSEKIKEYEKLFAEK